MATKKKAAKKKPAKKTAAPKPRSLRIFDGGTSPKTLRKVKHGDLIKIFGDKKLCFEVTVCVKEVPCLGVGGGGPIIITS